MEDRRLLEALWASWKRIHLSSFSASQRLRRQGWNRTGRAETSRCASLWLNGKVQFDGNCFELFVARPQPCVIVQGCGSKKVYVDVSQSAPK